VLLAAVLASMACLATPVRQGLHVPAVRAGPFLGLIAPEYDVVDGRFSLHVGPERDPATGLSQKIPWFASARSPVKPSVIVTGKRLDAEGAPWRQVLRQAWASNEGMWVYPSNLSPPSVGCWRLTFTSGKVRARLRALVR
jgi:hypothetical protein